VVVPPTIQALLAARLASAEHGGLETPLLAALVTFIVLASYAYLLAPGTGYTPARLPLARYGDSAYLVDAEMLALRRGEYGEAIHGLLGPVDELLADLVKRGQDSDVFAQHLPAGILSQVAYGVVFAIADSDLSNGTLGARAATITSLLMLGVPETRAIALVGDQP